MNIHAVPENHGQHRQARGLMQTDLAEQARVSRRAIVDLERGASQPHPTTLLRLAEALRLRSPQRERFIAAANQGKSPCKDGSTLCDGDVHAPVLLTDPP